MKDLGGRMAAQNGYRNIHGWQLYDTTGTTEDWSYNATGGYGYTFEIGPDEFHPPFPKMIDEYLGAGFYAGKGNREAFLIALENAANAKHHSVVSGKAPTGAVLRLTKEFKTSTSQSGFINDRLVSTLVVPSGNKYTWHVNPSTRPEVMEHRVRVIAAITVAAAGVQLDGASGRSATRSTSSSRCRRPGSACSRSNLDWPTPDDLDLVVYYRQAGRLAARGGELRRVRPRQGRGDHRAAGAGHVRAPRGQLRVDDAVLHDDRRSVRRRSVRTRSAATSSRATSSRARSPTAPCCRRRAWRSTAARASASTSTTASRSSRAEPSDRLASPPGGGSPVRRRATGRGWLPWEGSVRRPDVRRCPDRRLRSRRRVRRSPEAEPPAATERRRRIDSTTSPAAVPTAARGPARWQSPGASCRPRGHRSEPTSTRHPRARCDNGFGWVAVYLHDGRRRIRSRPTGCGASVSRAACRSGAGACCVRSPGARPSSRTLSCVATGSTSTSPTRRPSTGTRGPSGPDGVRYRRSQRFVGAFRALQPSLAAGLSSYCRADMHDLDWGAWRAAGFVFLPQAYVNDLGPDATPAVCARGRPAASSRSTRCTRRSACIRGRAALSGPRPTRRCSTGRDTTGFSVYLAETRMTPEEWQSLGSAIAPARHRPLDRRREPAAPADAHRCRICADRSTAAHESRRSSAHRPRRDTFGRRGCRVPLHGQSTKEEAW